jgi:hypothetical protein
MEELPRADESLQWSRPASLAIHFCNLSTAAIRLGDKKLLKPALRFTALGVRGSDKESFAAACHSELKETPGPPVVAQRSDLSKGCCPRQEIQVARLPELRRVG